MNDAIMIIIMQHCDDFQVHRFIKCVRKWKAAKDHSAADLPRTMLFIV